MSILSKKYFHDEAAAFAHVESILWPNGPICPHCGGTDNNVRLTGIRNKPNAAQRAKGEPGSERHGLHRCKDCRGQFTVRKGTLFEESHLALHKWLQAVYLLCSSKKGISTQQLKRTLEVDQKTAWFLGHRVREAMRSGDLRPFGQGGGAVEVDETFIGREPGKKLRPGYGHKMKVLSLVDRDSGQSRSMVVDSVGAKEIIPLLRANIAREARVMTDEGRQYQKLAQDFPAHQAVNHGADEYVREGGITTNTVEGFFSVFKRGMRGTYQHCRKQHLHRYLAEFDFRYTNRIAKGVDDTLRTRMALEGFKGKRLTYKGSDSAVI